MPNHRKSLKVAGDRTSIRKQVIMEFLNEEPGTGKGDDCSKYVYVVETITDSKKVILKRPANLNKGMDFTVHVENVRFKEKGIVDIPSHTDILTDLEGKKKSEPEKYKEIVPIIHKIYKCENVSQQELKKTHFRSGHSIEIILMAMKWLFIEQDVTYWNWSGRSMLFSALKEKRLC